jgi:uncharacterized protein (TIGR02466 family)
MFPIYVFRSPVKDHAEIKEKCLDFVEAEYQKKSTTFDTPWDCDVFTTYGQDINFPWQEILLSYIPNIEDMAKQLNISGAVAVNTAWFNAYKSGQSHDLHDHLPGQFSAIHYIKYDPNVHTPTIFVNPYRQVSLSSAPRHDTSDMSKVPPMWGPQSYVTVEEGDLVIFPSFFEHRVARQTTDELRVTLSFNFNFL